MTSLAIAQVGTADEGGGANTVARGLMKGYAARGHRVWHLVGRKRGADPNVMMLPDDDRWAYRASGYSAVQLGLRRLAGKYPDRGFGLASRSLRLATHPRARAARANGLEDFDFPGSERLIDRLDARPDIVHGHNLQGGYFDLRALEAIGDRVPTVLTMHDMWLMTGHCAYALGCERWKIGCGECPDLSLDPPLSRDGTRENWRRKQDIYRSSRLHVVTPSRWLCEQVGASMLAPAAVSIRVIPNGVDTAVFTPAARPAVRAALGLPSDAFIVLLTTGSRGSMWKDDKTLKDAMGRLADRAWPRPIRFIAVGRDSAIAANGRANATAIPFQHDPLVMASYYQAADLYLHAARADTCPLGVLEAMACGAVVVATAVGGIPEQIDDTTGVLVPPSGGAEMADAVDRLLRCDETRTHLSANAVRAIADRFTLDRQVDAYLALYRDILASAAANVNRQP